MLNDIGALHSGYAESWWKLYEAVWAMSWLHRDNRLFYLYSGDRAADHNQTLAGVCILGIE